MVSVFEAKGTFMEKNFTYIDLFSGCGGLSLGLYKAGWKGIFAIEKSPYAFLTLKHNLVDKCNHFNWPEWLPMQNHDINDVISSYEDKLKELEGKVTMVVGGPPCQGFSTAGRRNEKDERNSLVDSYIRFISILKPKYLFLENVKGFTIGFSNKKKTKRGKPYSIYVKEKLEDLGYQVSGKIVDFSHYGVPQRRKRFILIGCLQGSPDAFFERLVNNRISFLKKLGLNTTISLKEAISDLQRSHGSVESPDTKGFYAGTYGRSESQYQKYLRQGIKYSGKVADSHRFSNHRLETTQLFQHILDTAPKNVRIDGEMRVEYNLKKRGIFLLDEKVVCPTLTTHPDDYIHYCEPRILTVREYARIQSFPDWYEIKGKYTTGGELRVKEVPRYTQLGNAIPPLFSEQAGISLKEMVLNGK